MPRRVTTGILLVGFALAGPHDTPVVGQEAAASAGDAVAAVPSTPDTSAPVVSSSAGRADSAATSLESSAESTAESNQRKRNAIILAMLVAGIALTGLLLLIAAIVARGFLRKMARQSEAKRRAELALPPDAAAAAAEDASAGDVDESIPFSERETEVT